jgi:hypothetical protein
MKNKLEFQNRDGLFVLFDKARVFKVGPFVLIAGFNGID